jgi:polar amino acid transport system substrate-binding protein
MKRSTWLNFCSVNVRIAFAIALLAAFTSPAALAQDATAEPAADAVADVSTTDGMEPVAVPPPQTTLERVRATGSIRFGYRGDARPFSYRDESGAAAGYTVALCGKIAEQVKAELRLSALAVEWVPVTPDSRFSDLRDGRVDLLCGADTATLSRRQDVSFSLPIFPGGIGALVRSDAPARLQLVLEGRPLPDRAMWRANPAQVLQHKTFSAVAGSTAEAWLLKRIDVFDIIAKVVTVDAYAAGVERVLNRSSDVLFGDRAILLDAATRNPSSSKLLVLDRYYTFENGELALARGDEAFRLVVDRALSRFYASGELGPLYRRWFGEPSTAVLTYYRWNTRPE